MMKLLIQVAHFVLICVWQPNLLSFNQNCIGTNPGIWTLDFFYGLGVTQCYQLDPSLSIRLLKHFFEKVFLEHGGLPHVLHLAVHLNCTEEIEGVILSHFYTLSLFKLGLGWWVLDFFGTNQNLQQHVYWLCQVGSLWCHFSKLQIITW